MVGEELRKALGSCSACGYQRSSPNPRAQFAKGPGAAMGPILAAGGDAATLEDSWCLQVRTTEVTGVQVWTATGGAEGLPRRPGRPGGGPRQRREEGQVEGGGEGV